MWDIPELIRLRKKLEINKLPKKLSNKTKKKLKNESIAFNYIGNNFSDNWRKVSVKN
jgi:hypothetical protein